MSRKSRLHVLENRVRLIWRFTIPFSSLLRSACITAMSMVLVQRSRETKQCIVNVASVSLVMDTSASAKNIFPLKQHGRDSTNNIEEERPCRIYHFLKGCRAPAAALP